MKTVFCIVVAFASLASLRAAPTNNAAGLAGNLNQVMTLVFKAFEYIAETMAALKESQELDHEILQKVTKIQEQLATTHNESHASLQSQIAEIVVSLTNSMPAFDNLNASLAKLAALVPPPPTTTITSPTTTAAPTCPSTWQKFVDHCYKFVVMANENVDSAVAACSSYGANLTRVRSAEHQTFLLNGLPSKFVILGGNDRETEGTWVWPDGVLISTGGYTNWATGEPGIEDCMYIAPHLDKWADQNCSWLLGSGWGYVCEKLLK